MLTFIITVISIFEIAQCQNLVVLPLGQEATDFVCVDLMQNDLAFFVPNRFNPCSFYCVVNSDVTLYWYQEGKQCWFEEGSNFGACFNQACRRVDSKLYARCITINDQTNYAKTSDSNSCQIECFVLPSRISANVPAPDGSRCNVNNELGNCKNGNCNVHVTTTTTTVAPVPPAPPAPPT